MPFKSIAPNLYQLSSGPVNLWLVEDPAGLTLIDTNYRGRAEEILGAVRALGKDPARIGSILLTHCHPDHTGSLAALKQLTGAQAWMHPLDAAVVRGQAGNEIPLVSPGLLNRILFNLFIKNTPGTVDPAEIEHELSDGQVLPLCGGIQAIHTPGHSAGHTAFYLPAHGGGTLILGDTCSNMAGLDYSIVYSDIAEGRRSLARLARMQFNTVCFSHGGMLQGGAAGKFAKKWR